VQLNKMHDGFVTKGYPVVIGECRGSGPGALAALACLDAAAAAWVAGEGAVPLAVLLDRASALTEQARP